MFIAPPLTLFPTEQKLSKTEIELVYIEFLSPGVDIFHCVGKKTNYAIPNLNMIYPVEIKFQFLHYELIT